MQSHLLVLPTLRFCDPVSIGSCSLLGTLTPPFTPPLGAFTPPRGDTPLAATRFSVLGLSLTTLPGC